jgi:intracellular multiplication protein IcmK
MRKIADKLIHNTQPVKRVSIMLFVLGLSTCSVTSFAVEIPDTYNQQQLQQLQQLAQNPTSSPAVKQTLSSATSITSSYQQPISQLTAKPVTTTSTSTTSASMPNPAAKPTNAPLLPATAPAPISVPTPAAAPASAPLPQPATSAVPAQQVLTQATPNPMNNMDQAPSADNNQDLQQSVPAVDPNQAANEDAFAGMSQTLLPMSPDQIQRLKKMFNASQYAAAAPAGIPPKPTARSQYVNLAPGATPPVIRMAQGLVTSLVFLDSTGAPWPIEAYDIGNPAAFNIQWNKVDNTLLVQSMTLYNYGNLAVRLKGLTTPVMLTLIPGQQAVDYRVDLRVQGLGPNAIAMPVNNGMPNSANPDLLGVLDGIPPAGSRILNVSGGECQAWLLGDIMYVRTRLSVLSPSWLATMSSADGTRAYQMQKTPMLLVSAHGKPVQLKIEGL